MRFRLDVLVDAGDQFFQHHGSRDRLTPRFDVPSMGAASALSTVPSIRQTHAQRGDILVQLLRQLGEFGLVLIASGA